MLYESGGSNFLLTISISVPWVSAYNRGYCTDNFIQMWSKKCKLELFNYS